MLNKNSLYFKYLNWRWWKLNCKLSALFNGRKTYFNKHILYYIHKIENRLDKYADS
jgi:hypothetical protein